MSNAVKAAKGNVLIAQGGGPTAVINRSLYGAIRQAQKSSQVNQILGARFGITGVLQEQFINLGQQADACLEGLKQTPASALGSCRYKVQPDDYDCILRVLEKHDIRWFFYNGGNDSMDTAHQVHQLAKQKGLAVNVIGIPKTIDNDLPHTDRCPGFGSAARYVIQSVRDLGMDIRSLPTPVCIFEAMGRNAGWLAASAALSRVLPDDAPHLIYLPERAFDPDQFLADIQAVYDRQGWVVAVVSEGLTLANGKPVYAAGGSSQVDAFGHVLPGDVGSYLAGQVTEKLGLRARSEKPGLCGRSSVLLASDTDQQDAQAVGVAAVQAAVEEDQSGQMVTLLPRTSSQEPARTGLTPLASVANIEKVLPPDWINDAGNDVTQNLCDYVKPLVGKGLLEYTHLALR